MRDETACEGPDGDADTRSQTSRMRAQFSDVRFSSVALTGGAAHQQTVVRREGCHSPGATALTDDIVHGVGLRAEHGDDEGEYVRDQRATRVRVKSDEGVEGTAFISLPYNELRTSSGVAFQRVGRASAAANHTS